ncbi:molybdopterin-guanine dinucleotide biosynthesis protein MobB [Chromatium okenii]|uniref:molybdopterin-guanine dinucleotide biosynthesis protein MobB n=1 Tax=Chromatium okenii TaxID=61644 RepID=UPI0032218BC4
MIFAIPVIGVVAPSGSGKTTLLRQLVALLHDRGVRVVISNMPITVLISTCPARTVLKFGQRARTNAAGIAGTLGAAS